jgi:hypothetical protein
VPNIRWLIAFITATHRFVYRATRGWIAVGCPVSGFLLLTTIGRRTGQPAHDAAALHSRRATASSWSAATAATIARPRGG